MCSYEVLGAAEKEIWAQMCNPYGTMTPGYVPVVTADISCSRSGKRRTSSLTVKRLRMTAHSISPRSPVDRLAVRRCGTFRTNTRCSYKICRAHNRSSYLSTPAPCRRRLRCTRSWCTGILSFLPAQRRASDCCRELTGVEGCGSVVLGEATVFTRCVFDVS